MTAIIIDGKAIAEQVILKVKDRVETLKQSGITPGLTVVLVGDDPASQTYVGSKEKTSKRLGMDSTVLTRPSTVTGQELLELIENLNNDESVHGILIQLPLPGHIDENKVLQAIHPDKDVDGFHPLNVGKLLLNQHGFIPCTPFGVIQLLDYAAIPIEGKHAVIVGRSNIVGKPMGQLLLNRHATVTYTHSRTEDLASYTKQADILIVATGQPLMITAEHVKPGAAVIDVGIHRNSDGRLSGDVDFHSVKSVAGAITPVPGGVGPMTIAMLMENTCLSAERMAQKK
ncbi:bifunctional methylenetetrahydrofolate dehydrogenase/methenyltetrahydrofolate cyclohydrolase FolD [Chryseomicrobium aureum]|uniref:bifunctional methylenetetrahydrofolate dehydrogenase/methenyltetrahydrofolate cyclohydrolase FolD n=1 Tax=Chryseomicrobium aureum TaxID=1441723 RepID=UPI0019564ECD|nr:bifunctional methylenetetrahydrofolate dehydrogenase/methenyltetrahydrofolate cyclohydrolase FolD [Chryseomicrobium aureum]MBM7705703.1 methylenetetrahydrofolate dehydrogenase (NADP+)/methenyltetrahydrofolate cyclohydrolase [Chryseomicrobium aureum]